MKYQFHIVDVFTDRPFRGNQLAVLPQADGITSEGMQEIAREFNFAETTFVCPPIDPQNTCRVRIFTPGRELDFAGHPTVGTACVLSEANDPPSEASQSYRFEENVGVIPVEVTRTSSRLSADLTNTSPLELHDPAPQHSDIAEVLSLQSGDIVAAFFASVGTPFCMVHLKTPDAVDRASLDPAAWQRLLRDAWSPSVYLFSGQLQDGGELYARMFAPAWGIDEDPATGGAAAALVGAAAHRLQHARDSFALRITQGVSLGRQSIIHAKATLETW